MRQTAHRFLRLFEMPMRDMSFQGNWDPKAKIGGDPDEYGDDSQFGVWDVPTVKKMQNAIPVIRKRFENIDTTFDFIMVREDQKTDLDSSYVEFGQAGDAERARFADYIKNPTEDAITVIFTNNTGDGLVTIAKPGNFVHRLAHVFGATARRTKNANQGISYAMGEMEREIQSALVDLAPGYGFEMQKSERGPWGTSHGWLRGDETQQLINAQMLTAISNGPKGFNASKANKLARPYEFIYESLANYVQYGKINLNEEPGPIRVKWFKEDLPGQAREYTELPSRNEYRYGEESYDWLIYPETGDEDEPYDYDAEPEFDEEAFEASLYRRYNPNRGGYWNPDYLSASLANYWDEVLYSAEGQVFIM